MVNDAARCSLRGHGRHSGASAHCPRRADILSALGVQCSQEPESGWWASKADRMSARREQCAAAPVCPPRASKGLAKRCFGVNNNLRMASNSRISLPIVLLCSVYLSAAVAAPMSPNPKPYTGKGLAPAYLRCEYLIDPLGIDEIGRVHV